MPIVARNNDLAHANFVYFRSFQQIPVERPSNDRCETSTRLDGLPALEAGNSNGAWPIAFSSAANQECSVKESARGLYYSFEGIDGRVAIILSNLEVLEGGRFEVALFSNNTCQECITYRDFLFTGQEHGFPITLQAGTNYTLLVAGEGYSDVGTFVIDIKVRIEWCGGFKQVENFTVSYSFLLSSLFCFSREATIMLREKVRVQRSRLF
jgi:hypothetical protein